MNFQKKVKCATCGGVINLEENFKPNKISISFYIECLIRRDEKIYRYYDFCDVSCLERSYIYFKDILKNPVTKEVL